MNFTNLQNGEFTTAYWLEFDRDENEYKKGKPFRYTTYDDSQWRSTVQERQQGGQSSRSSVSIQTHTQHPFKQGDKIEFPDESIRLRISGVEKIKNTSTTMRNLVVSGVSSNPYRLHLNKEDI